jgi:hypothetical protein
VASQRKSSRTWNKDWAIAGGGVFRVFVFRLCRCGNIIPCTVQCDNEAISRYPGTNLSQFSKRCVLHCVNEIRVSGVGFCLNRRMSYSKKSQFLGVYFTY